MATFQALPGFRDVYPEEAARRGHVFRLWRRTAAAFGFSEYDGPVLEPLELYRTKSGEEIEGQLFAFADKGGREVALRPEMTPTVCRLVGARAGSLKRPVKWFSIAECYRYERAQKGRQRAFHQLNADLFGEPGPEAEVELIALLVECFRALGLTEADFRVRLSDRSLWFHFLGALGFGDERARDVLAAIDKLERSGEEAFAAYAERHGPIDPDAKAGILSFSRIRSMAELEAVRPPGSDEASRRAAEAFAARLGDWRRLIAGLEAMGLGGFLEVDLGVVRGLAYYTGFVFEAFDRQGDLRALAGGGRYDDLVGKLGYADLPAAGFAIGEVTTGLLLERLGLAPALVAAPDVYCVIGGEEARRIAFGHIHRLRASGFRVEYPFKDGAFGKQFKAAGESGARVALVYGSDEVGRGAVKIRDLVLRTEREVPLAEVESAVRDQLSGSG